MSVGLSRGQGQDPPPVPPEWHARFVEMESHMLRPEAELREVRQQQQQPAPMDAKPQAVMSVVVPQVAVVENKLEQLYERFQKKYPPTFDGGPD